MPRLSVLLTCILATTTAACLSTLSPQGQEVRIGKMEPQGGCKELGLVYGSGGGGPYTGAADKLESSQNELRNKTAELGGNYVAMDAAGSDINGMSLAGRAYYCIVMPTSGGMAIKAPPAVTPSAPVAPTAEQRLTKLKDLREKNLITQDEYDTRRAEILRSL